MATPPAETLHILVLEAYDGGSHGRFLDGLLQYSRHRFTRLSLPPRKWKWRMRGSALFFAETLRRTPPDGSLSPASIDLIFTSDMTAVADLKALLPPPLSRKPIVCYFHENQLTYPLPDESQRDYQYGFTNLTSCLAADAVWFNSRYHLDSFLQAADALLRKMPDCVPTQILPEIARKAAVLPLGLEPDCFAEDCSGHPPAGGTSEGIGHLSKCSPSLRPSAPRHPPAILWNHRWEYDKNPDDFFETLFDLHRARFDFRLIVAGQHFRQSPPIFAAARRLLADHLDHYGYVADRAEYLKLVSRADLVVSTAVHEFFGLSVLEAIAAGCYPLLPHRLSYPELLPENTHSHHLYRNRNDLRKKLTHLCRKGVPAVSSELSDRIRNLSWPRLAPRYDQAFREIAPAL